MATLSDDRRLKVARLQNLYIKLLFCQITLTSYESDPQKTLAQFGLPLDATDQLPDTTTKNFVAEARGRRGGVRRTINAHFPRTLGLLDQMADLPDYPAEKFSFETFLSSDYFFKSTCALPHPTGLGPGYESTSKFYFWFRELYGTARSDTDLELRKTLNIEFSNYLMEQVTGRAQDYYKRFAGGVYWPCVPGRINPIHLVSDQLYLFEIKDQAKIAQISTIGLTNLDDLQPVDWEIEENIL